MTRTVRRRRPPRRAVLIVCEGQNTEPRYFDRLAKVLSLAATVATQPSVTRRSRTSGVLPTRSISDWAVAIGAPWSVPSSSESG